MCIFKIKTLTFSNKYKENKIKIILTRSNDKIIVGQFVIFIHKKKKWSISFSIKFNFISQY